MKTLLSSRSKSMRAVQSMAAIAGLLEGIAIARYDVLMADPTLGAWLRAALTVAGITALHLTIWSALAWVVGRFVRDDLVVPLVFSLWALAVGQGRELLDDRTVRWTWRLVGLGLMLGWAPTVARIRRAPSDAAAAEPGWVFACRGLAVVSIAFFGLFGRVPDFSFPTRAQLGFLIGTSLAALLIVTLTRHWPKATAAGLLLVLALGCLRPLLRAEAQDRPNVLWILIDTTRRDSVQPYGDAVATPAIAKLASEGVLFDDAVTVVPKTPASVASFFTGTYPTHHGVRSLYDRLEESRETVAEAFRATGYDTAAFVNNAWLSQGRGFAQGFDRFNGFYEVSRPWGPLRYASWWVLFDRLGPQRIETFNGETRSEDLTDQVVKHLDQRSKRPFFVYAHYFEPHWPYFPPAELAKAYGGPPDGDSVVNYIKQTRIGRGNMIFKNPLPEAENEKARALYRAEIDHTMTHVGRLIDHLETLGLKENTLVVFTADHGHALGEHAYYFHHGEFLYEPSTRIPLIMRWPGHVPAGKVVKAQVRSIDVAPTDATLVGLRGLEEVDGVDLSRLWSKEPTTPLYALLESDVGMFHENDRRPLRGIIGKLRALRDGHHKLILTPTPSGLELELYDLEADPEEQFDLARDPALAETRERLLALLFEQLPAAERIALSELASGGGQGELDETQVDENELELLRSLGYI